ncbi:CASP-like protein 1D2 [Prosopis cineraria]|uniref:CASP-like protein 1D2 n=1 Tax=Prosopis cineraria TaxID=364024 RepID=UPI00240EDEE2|nr:CASP-like protein 1D2 [Prosopis cineraria]
MASTDKPESAYSSAPASGDYFTFDVILRFLLFAASVVAVVVIATGDQTEMMGPMEREANFKNSPALIYFLVAFSVSGLYSIITFLASISVLQKPDLKLKFLLYFIFWDALILGIIASATGTAGGVAYVGLKGNRHVSWTKICNVYDKFCRHIAGSLAVALFGSIVTVLLIWLSAYNLHSRVPK